MFGEIHSQLTVYSQKTLKKIQGPKKEITVKIKFWFQLLQYEKKCNIQLIMTLLQSHNHMLLIFTTTRQLI